MENPVLIIGAGSIGRAALDIFRSNNVEVYGFLDEDKTLYDKEIDQVPVMGSPENDDFFGILGKKCEAFVASDEVAYKRSMVDLLNKKRRIMPVNAIHAGAVISEMASMGHGNMINARVVMGPGVSIGGHCNVHTGVILEQGITSGNYVQIGAGSIIGPGVTIEDDVFIGSGVTVVGGVKIGSGARIGAGSVVVADVASSSTLFGNPAKAVE